MIHIVHTEASQGWGGQEIRIWKEACAFKALGYRITIWTEKNTPLAKRAEEAGLRVRSVGFKKRFFGITLFKMLYWLYKDNVDIVHTHSSQDSWLAGIAAKLMGKKVIRTRHLSTPIRPGINSYFLYNKLADFVITTCQKAARAIATQSRCGPARCACIATGIDPEKMHVDKKTRSSFRRRWRIPEDQVVVGTVCVLRSWKGLNYLIEAAQAFKNYSNITFMIVGGGEHFSYFAQIPRNKGLEDKVIFTNHLENPIEAIEAMDIFCLLSESHEGISQSTLQAAYLGKPLITTDVGGLTEVCLHGATGLVVPAKDSHKTAVAIETLLDETYRLDLGKQAKKLVEEKFMWSESVEQIEKIVLQLVNPQ